MVPSRDGDEGVAGRNGKVFHRQRVIDLPSRQINDLFYKMETEKNSQKPTLVAPLTKRPLCRRVCTAAVAATVEKQQAPSNFKMSLAKAKNALSYPSKEVASNDRLWLTSLQSVRNARHSQQRFWHCHEE